MILFVHASPVSLAATQAGLERFAKAPVARHALVPGLVDPRAMHFAHAQDDYVRLRDAVAAPGVLGVWGATEQKGQLRLVVWIAEWQELATGTVG